MLLAQLNDHAQNLSSRLKQSRSQSPRVIWSVPRHGAPYLGADQKTRGLRERD